MKIIWTVSSDYSLSRVWLFATPWTAARQASLSITNSSSVIPFSSCLQSFPASGSFPRSQLFASGGQRIGVSASVLPVNIQDWSPLGWTGWISLQSKGLSRVFSSTTVQKHPFFSAQRSLWSSSHIYTWLLGKPELWLDRSFRTDTAAAKSLQACPTLCDPTDGSPPGSPVPGILQARTLEWVAISFSFHSIILFILIYFEDPSSKI